ncbi:MAG: shikimate kinase AroK [Xanthomonadales bacterium]|nr:shikimate kinase AroK [Xanthomonadales bacterium]
MLNERIFFIGPTGAGKTTIGKRVAAHYGLEFRDLDQEIERRTGADVGLIFDIEGEGGFRKRETNLLQELSERSGVVLATGAGAVLAEENQRILRAHGFVVYLQTEVDQQIRRLSRDKRRPLIQKPNRREILGDMARIRNPIYESLADLIIPSENLSVHVMARRVINRIEEAVRDPVP